MKIVIISVVLVLLIGVISFGIFLSKKKDSERQSSTFTEDTLFSKPTAELITQLLAGNVDIAKDQIPEGADVNEKSESYLAVNPLMYAILQVNQPAVEALLRLGADPNVRMSRDENAYTLSYSIVRKHPEIMETVIRSGKADLNALLPDGEPVLAYLAFGGHEKILRLAFEYGANPNIKTRGRRPLSIETAIQQEFGSVEIILDAGGDPNATDAAGISLVDYLKKSAVHTIDPDGQKTKQGLELIKKLEKKIGSI